MFSEFWAITDKVHVRVQAEVAGILESKKYVHVRVVKPDLSVCSFLNFYWFPSFNQTYSFRKIPVTSPRFILNHFQFISYENLYLNLLESVLNLFWLLVRFVDVELLGDVVVLVVGRRAFRRARFDRREMSSIVLKLKILFIIIIYSFKIFNRL